MRFFITSCAVLGAMATSAAAQDAICPSLPAGSWIAGGRDASDIATSAEALEALSLAPAGQVIVSNFTVSQPTELRLEAVGGMGSDTVIDLYNDRDDLVASDDDSGGGLDSRIEMMIEPGDYCLKTSSYDEGLLSATIRVGRMEHEPLTEGLSAPGPGGSGREGVGCDDAPVVVVNPDADGKFETQVITGSVDDLPVVRLELTGDAPMLLEAINVDADPTLGIYDFEGGNELHYNDDFDGLNSGIELPEGLAAGSYCIGLDALSDTSLPIEIKASHYDAEAAYLRKAAAGDMVPREDGSYPIEDMGVLNGRSAVELPFTGDALWFKIEVEEAALLRIDAAGTGDNDDPRLELFDDLGGELAYNEDVSVDDYSSRIYYELFPGIYFFNVTEYDQNSTTIRVSVREYQAVRRR